MIYTVESFVIKVLIYAFPLFFFQFSFAQSHSLNITQGAVTSPEMAMLGRFGDIPVSPYNGTVGVEIPLYVLEEYGFQVPIMLRYHSSGIKVSDQASNVGLGWLLDVGGAIIQSVNGIDDAEDRLPDVDPIGFQFVQNNIPVLGTYTPRPSVGTDIFCNGSGVSGDTYMLGYYSSKGHGQPDIYYFSLPSGLNGKFYVNPITKEVAFIDKKVDLNVQKIDHDKWIIKDLDGIKYVFNAREKAIHGIDVKGSSWKLTQIELVNGSTIDFSYVDKSASTTYYTENYHSDFLNRFPNSDSPGINRSTQTLYEQIKVLDQISSASHVIKFNTESREDINGGLRLSTIDICDTEDRILKRIRFNQDYFGYTTIGGHLTAQGYQNTTALTIEQLHFLGKRLRLNSIDEIFYDNGIASFKTHKFGYDPKLLPLKTSAAKDFWGYYNGQQNTCLLPSMSYFYDTGYYPPTLYDVLYSYEGANRAADGEYMTAGVLTSIEYPTKGTTNFVYEPHEFSNYKYPDAPSVSASKKLLRVEDQNETHNVTNRTFTINNVPSSGISVKLRARFSNGHTLYNRPDTMFYRMLEANIIFRKIKNGSLSTLREFKLLIQHKDLYIANGGIDFEEEILLPKEEGVTYIMSAGLPSVLGPQNSAMKGAGVYFSVEYRDAPIPSFGVGGGLRIAELINKDYDGRIVERKKYEYEDDQGISSGKLMSKLEYAREKKIFFYYLNPIPNSYPVFVSDYKPIWFFNSNSHIALSNSAQGNYVGYSKVTISKLDENNDRNGKEILEYINLESIVAMDLPESPNLSNGLLTKQTYLNADDDILKTKSFKYRSIEDDLYTAFVVDRRYMIDRGECQVHWYHPNMLEYEFQSLITIKYYPIQSKWFVMFESDENEYFASDTVNIKTLKSYNDKGQLIEEKTQTSDNRLMKTTYTYPIDYPLAGSESSWIVGDLISSNRYNTLLEKKTSLEGLNTFTEKYLYSAQNSNVVLAKLIKLSNSNVSFTQIFRNYDNYLNPQETEIVDGKNIVYLWGYDGQYPVAKIENATYSEVLDILGQSTINGLNSPNVSDAVIVNVMAALRSNPFMQKAQVTSYTYKPLVGMTSMTDPRGITEYYQYDGFQRLKDVLDFDKNLLQNYQYHYRP